MIRARKPGVVCVNAGGVLREDAALYYAVPKNVSLEYS